MTPLILRGLTVEIIKVGQDCSVEFAKQAVDYVERLERLHGEEVSGTLTQLSRSMCVAAWEAIEDEGGNYALHSRVTDIADWLNARGRW